MGMAAPTYYTAEMVRQMPDDGNTYEVVHGELLVTPAPRVWHQLVAQRLGTALGEYLRYQPIGHVFAARSDISWGLDDVLVEPDVFVAPLDQVQTLDWAQKHPDDPRLPEALHRAVQASRYRCTDADTGKYSKQAFNLLHRKYPKSSWTARTKYWYK